MWYDRLCSCVWLFLLFASVNVTHRNRSHFCVYRPVLCINVYSLLRPIIPFSKKNRVATIAAFSKHPCFLHSAVSGRHKYLTTPASTTYISSSIPPQFICCLTHTNCSFFHQLTSTLWQKQRWAHSKSSSGGIWQYSVSKGWMCVVWRCGRVFAAACCSFKK